MTMDCLVEDDKPPDLCLSASDSHSSLVTYTVMKIYVTGNWELTFCMKYFLQSSLILLVEGMLALYFLLTVLPQNFGASNHGKLAILLVASDFKVAQILSSDHTLSPKFGGFSAVK